MNDLKNLITAYPPTRDRYDESKEPQAVKPDRRAEERLDFLRPVFFLCRGIDGFHQGTILNYSTRGMCLHTAFPVEPLTGIFLTNRRGETASFYYNTGETAIAKAVWCEMRAGAYCVGIRFNGGPHRMVASEFEGNIFFFRR